MIQTHIEYDKRQLDALKKAAEESRSAVQNAQPAYRRSAVFLDRWVQENFRSEGGKVGGWDRFQEGGRRVKIGTRQTDTGRTVGVWAIDTSAKLLQKTGALRISYRPFATKNDAGIGSELPYSETHNEGIGVPKRRMLPEDEEVREDIRDILDQYVESNVLDNIRNAFK